MKKILGLILVCAIVLFSGCTFLEEAFSVTITFNGNGATSGSMAPQTTGISEPMNKCAFTKDGYTFVGWALSPTGSVKYEDGDVCTDVGEVTLYAVWVEDNALFTVTFNNNGGMGTMEPQTFARLKSKQLRKNSFTKAGCEFVGWALKATGSKKYTDEQNIILQEAEDMTLYAVWDDGTSDLIPETTVTATITFDPNGGKGSNITQNLYKEFDRSIRKNIFVRSGHIFKGWATTPTGDVYYLDETQFDPNQQTATLYAIWEEGSSSDGTVVNYYTVTFKSNASTTGSMNKEIFTEGVEKRLFPNDFVRSGYKFAGWATSANGEKVYYDEQNISITEDMTLYTLWEDAPPQSYTVTFKANGGEGTMENQAFTHDVEKKLTSSRYAKTGSTFKGWATSENGNTVYDDEEIIALTENTTLYAIWESTVSYKANGGTGDMSTQPFTHGETITLKSNAFTKEGYTFKGWATSESGDTVKYTNGEQVTLTEDTTLSAVWKENTATVKTYTVTFNANNDFGDNDGIIMTQTFTDGVESQLNSNLLYQIGYTFKGWATSSTGDMVYADSESISIEEDIELYAVWKANTYTVTFNPNGGSGSMDTQTFVHGVEISLTANDFNKSGSAFKGWATSENGETVEYTDGKSISIEEDTNLYAIWEANTYKVTFYANGCSGSMDPQTFVHGVEIPLTANDFEKSGNTFKGWATSENGETVYDDGERISIEEDTNLYAIWGVIETPTVPPETYTLTFNANGGEGTMDSQTFTENIEKTLTSNKFTKEGYTFTGWSTSNGGEKVYDNADRIIISENTTLYPVWEKTTCTVKFYCSKIYSEDTMEPQTFTHGESQQLKPNDFTSEYIFMGWQERWGGKEYDDKAEITITESVTLSPVWGCNITLDPNGGTGEPKTYTLKVDDTTQLEKNTFTKEGYIFEGWTSTPTNTKVWYEDEDNYSPMYNNKTYYAVWQEKPKGYLYFEKEPKDWWDRTEKKQSFTLTEDNKMEANSITLEKNTYVNEDYKFMGWSTEKGGTTVLFNDGETVSANRINELDDRFIYLYPVWEKYPKITYYPGKEDISTWYGNSKEQYYDPGEKLLSSSDCGFHDNTYMYKFAGWSESEDVSEAYKSGAVLSEDGITTDRTLYGVWEPKNIISFVDNSNGRLESGYMDRQEFEEDVSTPLSECTYIVPGYNFLGWSTNPDATTAEYTDEQEVVIGDDIPKATKLYAIWEMKNIIKFDGNGATTETTMQPQEFEENVYTALSYNKYSKFAHKFVGWSKTSGGSVAYTDEEKIKVGSGGNLEKGDTLYAVWKKMEGVEQGNAIVKEARDYLAENYKDGQIGYVLGGKTAAGGLDCSGFVSLAYRDAGYTVISGSSASMSTTGSKIITKSELNNARGELWPGDLLYFDADKDGRIDHVALYTGEMNMIHSEWGNGVNEECFSNWYQERFTHAQRVVSSSVNATIQLFLDGIY